MLIDSPIWMLVGVSWPVIFLAVAIPGPALTMIFYNIGLQNYRAFVEAVLSAVDLYRLDLLRSLRLDLPKDSVEERDTWMKLMEWTNDPVVYKHSDVNEEKKPDDDQTGQEGVVKSILRKRLGVK